MSEPWELTTEEIEAALQAEADDETPDYFACVATAAAKHSRAVTADEIIGEIAHWGITHLRLPLDHGELSAVDRIMKHLEQYLTAQGIERPEGK